MEEQHVHSLPHAHSLPRKERERLERKAAMLEAAQEVFAEKGYNSATLDEVASRAEYGKGTLYNYFPGGKEEILLAIVEHFHDELCALIERTFIQQEERPFREALEIFLQRTFAFFLERSELFLTLLREAHRIGLSDDPRPRKFFAAQRERAFEALSIPLQRAMDKGEVRTMPPRLLAHMILVNLNGAQMRTCMAHSDTACDFPESAADMAQFLTELVMDGVSQDIRSSVAEPTPAQ